LTERN